MGIVIIIFIAWYLLLKDYFDGKQKNIKLNFHTKKEVNLWEHSGILYC